jgi:serine protein kinase
MTERIAAMQDFQALQGAALGGRWFEEYLGDRARKAAGHAQRVPARYDMIISYGTEEYIDNKKKLVRYNFFKDEHNGGANAIFGLDIPLMRSCTCSRPRPRGTAPRSASSCSTGPVGSSKSTIARLLKLGVEQYSRSAADGALYTFDWAGLAGLGIAGVASTDIDRFPEPDERRAASRDPAGVARKGHRPARALERQVQGPRRRRPRSGESLHLQHLVARSTRATGRRWSAHVRVRRLVLSEKDRVGIGTFQPKDEKNQDSTELTGDINYRKIAEYGSDSDPRAFNFDGEFNIANRGIVEFIEVLKLDVAFLYDLLGATQEHKIKPKKFAQTDIDEVIIGHTNEPSTRSS